MAVDAGSEEGTDRTLLQEAVRRMLSAHWRRDSDGGDVAGLYSHLVDQGLTGMGSAPDLGDLPDIIMVMQELGRVACAAPLLPAILANIALAGRTPTPLEGPLAFAVCAPGADHHAGRVHWQDDKVSGSLRFVENMDIARRVLVLAGDAQLLEIEVSTQTVIVSPTPGLSRPALSDIELSNARAVVHSLAPEMAARLLLIARLCCAARALGAARQGFELVLEYVKQRRQFGRTIGQFQAIQHKLADSRTVLDGAGLAIEAAAQAYARNPAAWPLAANSAIVFCTQTLRQVALETQHCFGAIGFAEEHEAPLLFRRVHGDVTAFGGRAQARAALSQLLFDEDEDVFAAADAGAQDPAAALRSEFKTWLNGNWTEVDRRASRATPFSERKWNLPFAAKLGAAGWSTLSWPVAAGGRHCGPVEQLAYAEELLRARAPDGPLIAGCRLLAPEVIAHGTPELQERLLPALREGRASVCLGYSEPESGSDLASLKTRADLRGDHFLINGQKIWTTDGHRATHMILAARTNPDPQIKHGGISLFVLPMDTPGITIRKSMAMYGHVFCNIFFDDVRVPVSHLLGKVDGGWRILANALASERVVMGAFATQVRDLFRRIVGDLKQAGLARDAVTRDRMAGLCAEVEVARHLSLRSITLSGGRYTPLVESAMAKVFASELSQRLTEAAIDMFGAVATLGEDAPGVPAEGLIDQLLRQSIMMVVGGGTNEIQRSVIAQRGLGLPPDR